MNNTKRARLIIYILLFFIFFIAFSYIFIKFKLLALIFVVGISIFLLAGVVVASKGDEYEEQVDSLIDRLVGLLVKINLGTYDLILTTIRSIIQFLKEIYVRYVIPVSVFTIIFVISYGLLLLLRYVNKTFYNGITYFVIAVAFLAPLLINYLQYGFKKYEGGTADEFALRVKKTFHKSVLSSIEIGLAFVFFFVDSNNAWFIPDDLREVPLVSYLGPYDLTLRLYSTHQLDFAFMLVFTSVLINFVKVLFEKSIYNFYLHHGYINPDPEQHRRFKYTNLVLTTLALHIIFLPFIRLKHLMLTVGFFSNFVADVFAALKEREVWIKESKEPVDIVGQLNKYIVVPLLKKILRIFAAIT